MIFVFKKRAFVYSLTSLLPKESGKNQHKEDPTNCLHPVRVLKRNLLTCSRVFVKCVRSFIFSSWSSSSLISSIFPSSLFSPSFTSVSFTFVSFTSVSFTSVSFTSVSFTSVFFVIFFSMFIVLIHNSVLVAVILRCFCDVAAILVLLADGAQCGVAWTAVVAAVAQRILVSPSSLLRIWGKKSSSVILERISSFGKTFLHLEKQRHANALCAHRTRTHVKKGHSHRRRNGIWTKSHTCQWKFISSIRDKCQFEAGVNGWTFRMHHKW